MSKITPGPWKVVQDDFGFCIKQRDDGGDIRSIAEIRKYPPGGGTAECNARLIAAVPELLLELDNCLDLLVTCFPDSPDNSRIGVAVTKARAAIDKAEGKP